MCRFDLDFIREQFPAFHDPETSQWAFFENAGGSYACHPVVAKLNRFMTATKMQPYGVIVPAQETGEAMDDSHQRLAAYLNADPVEISFGPSTSINTYVIAQALRDRLQAGDEIIVTNQDHEANIGVWRRLAEGNSGVIVREWSVDPQTGLLAIDDLSRLLNARTRLVCVTHCSNIVGAVNDIKTIADQVHQSPALLAVDGVSYAPHLTIDVKALDVDFYYFSLYKTFGPHQGLLYTRRNVLETLPCQGHFFNAAFAPKKLTPAGPQHGEIACAGGIIDYLEAAYCYHRQANALPQTDDDLHHRLAAIMALGHRHEIELSNRILNFLRTRAVRIIGNDRAEFGSRAPTIAFSSERWQPLALAEKLSTRKIGTGAGHFYAYRLMQALNIDPEQGVVRLSLVHYTSDDDVDRLLNALDEIL